MPHELTDHERDRAETLIGGLGVAPTLLKQTLTNTKLTKTLVEVITENGLEEGCSKEVGALVMMVGGPKFPASAKQHRPLLMDYIKSRRIATNDQCDAALKALKAAGDGALDTAAFERACGVGVNVSDGQIADAVAAVFEAHAVAIREERYHFNFMKLLQPIKSAGADMAWADIGKVKAEIDAQAAAMLGPKTAEDEAPRAKPKKTKAPKAAPAAAAAAAAAPADEREEDKDPYRFFPQPVDNHAVHTEVRFSDGHVEQYSNTREQLARHLEETKGQVVTRFPPEPNGYLHIGHAKAMFVDFGMAAARGGRCLLRFDDTNPEAEKREYIDHIQEIVAWMGWRPWKTTYSSDYFPQLYELALGLIEAGKAYVCHQTSEEIKACREARAGSPWRDRPIAETRRLFQDMRRGLFDEGTATLRLRMDPQNDNRNMDDLVAYRIKFVEHPHAGAAWCIYPSYDYTHCIVDSLEGITHSLCTLEFESRRASYFWLLHNLDLYMPVVWEYARLNITNNVMSKRKLQKLVAGRYVRGWDDPRMPTLAGMRRRGITPQAINALCLELGITRNDNEIALHKLFHHVRLHLDETSPRALAVLRPLKLVIDNLPDDHWQEVHAADFPGRGDAGYLVPFTKVCYIEATDFREVDAKDFYGLAPGKAIMLRYAYPVTYVSHAKDTAGRVSEVHVECDLEHFAKGAKPPKGVVNWVGQPRPGQTPATAEARLYAEALFKSQTPGDTDDWLADLNDESEEVLKEIYISPRLLGAKVLDRFQFERLGYFCVDSDSTPDALVFNRTCSLRDSYVKGR